MGRRLLIDTDTAGDDAQALLLAALAESIDLEAVTVVAGNVPFDDEVANAKYTLDLAGVASDVPVHEGARRPLLKEFDHVEHVHGEGGLGGEIFPDTGIESADGHAVEAILDAARDAPGEVSLMCIGPLTNVALAARLEPDLDDLLDEVWVMGGAANTLGNDTPSAEFNFWVDPDAASRVLDEFDVTLVDWGLSLRDSYAGDDLFDRVAALDTDLADFFESATAAVRQDAPGAATDGITQPDSVTAALMAYPELRETVSTYHVAVDDREGLTRGYSSVDVADVTDGEARTRVVEAADSETFRDVIIAMLRDRDPDSVV